MSKNKKDKKKKQKEKQLTLAQLEQQKFDIIQLLKFEKIDTKPNFAKFLDTYVERIAAVVDGGRMQFYPVNQYSLSKIYVKFLDKHELMFMKYVLPGKQCYYMYDDFDEVPLKQKELELVEKFFNYLLQFKFVWYPEMLSTK